MKVLSLSIIFLSSLQVIQAITISSPTKGQKVDMKHGLAISWSLDKDDNQSANVTIDLFIDNLFYLLLTPEAGVPASALGFTYLYTSPNYISEQDNYVVHLFDGSGKEATSDAFSMYDTSEFVKATSTSTIKRASHSETSGIRKGTPSPSLSTSPWLSIAPVLSETRTATTTPTSSQNTGTHAYGEVDAVLNLKSFLSGLMILLILGFEA